MTQYIDNIQYETKQYIKPFAIMTNIVPYPLHLHKHLEFLYVTEGEIELLLHKKRYTMKAGDCVLITPYTLHGYAPKSASCKRFVLVFEPESVGILGSILLDYYPSKLIINSEMLQSKLSTPLMTLFADIANKHSSEPADEAHRFMKIIQLLDAMLPLIKLKKYASSKNTAFIQAASLCNTSYEDPTFSIRSIAKMLHISESYIKQLFNKELGMSVKKYLTALRISKAETMLMQGTDSIARIAQESGFGSVRTFNRIFKEQKGETPYTFRASIHSK